MALFEQINYWMNLVAGTIFILLFIVAALFFYFFKIKKVTATVERVNHSTFRRTDALEYVKFNDILSESDKYVLSDSGELVEQLLLKMVDEYHMQQVAYKNVVNLHIQTALIEVLRAYPDVLYGKDDQPNLTQKILNSTINFIRNNVSLNIATEDVAKTVNLSSRQLNRIYDANVNMSVSEFIRNERILRVREYLKKTNLCLHEIARLTGFNDEYVLCKSFKKVTNTTPGKYRSSHKKKG